MVTVSPGDTAVLDVTVHYARPATLDVSIRVKGLPAGVALQDTSVILCPAGSPYSGGAQPLTCVNGFGYGTTTPTTGKITLTGLPGGLWTAYPGYCTMFGCVTNPAAGSPAILYPGRTTRVHLVTGYVRPPEGIVEASVTVTGAPAGFNQSVGLMACQIQISYSDCQSSGGFPPGTPDELELTAGVWQITGYYTAPVFANPILGPTSIIDVRGGRTTDVTLAVPYQVLGTAAGTIHVPGKPVGVRITSYSMTACPANGSGPLPFLSCVSEYSGPGAFSYGAADIRRLGRTAKRVSMVRAAGAGINTYSLPTLTPGKWVLTATYSTAFGSFSPLTSTKITVTAGDTTTRNLFVPYQTPALGDVTGRVTVVDAPAYGFQAGAQACSSAPVAGTCTDEYDAYLGPYGTYQLDLMPGTWWVSGLVYLYGSSTTQTITSPPRKVTVVAGSKTKASFIVPVG